MSARAVAQDELGQVLPLMALFMTVLLLFAALAVDVTGVLSAERFYTTTADAAALAGAQDLQTGLTRSITSSDRQRARTHAMEVLVSQLGASAAPACDPATDISECPLPGTPYEVSIQTPSPSCVACDEDRAVQVTVRHPSYGLTFARLVGQNEWNVVASAVATMGFPGQYALLALKPIDSNFQDGVEGNGGAKVRVTGGDIGTNTNADLAGSNSEFILDPYYSIYYDDDSVGTQWGSAPPGESLTSPIPDPAYTEPAWPDKALSPLLFYAGQGDPDAVIDCLDPLLAPLPSRVQAYIDAGDDPTCYLPGVYEPGSGNQRQFNVGSQDVVYLTPGAYKFEGGLDVSGVLLGGLIDNEPGVVLSFPSDKEGDLESSEVLVLNTGEDCSELVCGASPALDFADPPKEVKTPEPAPDGMVITFYVPRIESCFTGVIPIECSDEPQGEPDFKLAGTSEMNINGVIYAPTEKIRITGNSGVQAIDGQIVGWTLAWRGGSALTLNYPDTDSVGILRLNSACTGREICNA